MNIKWKTALQCVTAFIPFLVTGEVVSHGQGDLLTSAGYRAFCVLSGLAWCGFFCHVYLRTSRRARRRLWWLSPLVLFAFGAPGYLLVIWLLIDGV